MAGKKRATVNKPGKKNSKDGVQTDKVTLPKSTREWEELYEQTRARIGPPGTRFKNVIDKLELKAIKDQEGRELGGDTDDESDEEEENDDNFEDAIEEDEDEEEEKDEEEEDKENAPLTSDEILNIQRDAANPSTRLGPMPGSILAMVYNEDKDDTSDSDFEDLDSVESMDSEDTLEELDDNDEEMLDIN